MYSSYPWVRLISYPGTCMRVRIIRYSTARVRLIRYPAKNSKKQWFPHEFVCLKLFSPELSHHWFSQDRFRRVRIIRYRPLRVRVISYPWVRLIREGTLYYVQKLRSPESVLLAAHNCAGDADICVGNTDICVGNTDICVGSRYLC